MSGNDPGPVKLRGMTWSHPRGLDPLLAATRAYSDPGVTIEWEARSLKGFEEASIADLAADYDLIAIDHPFMGKAFEQHALQPLDTLFDTTWLQQLRGASVGPSFESYVWNGSLWAIPVDAAAQVAAYRADLLDAANTAVPQDWQSVLTLGAHLRTRGQWIAVPANPTHLFLAWATICHAFATSSARQGDLRPLWWTDNGIETALGARALGVLSELLKHSHPISWDADPIELFEHMSRNGDIAYTPVAFGYSNYARPTDGLHALRFAGVPSEVHSGGAALRGGMLGGVGLAVSHRCTQTAAAARFLKYVADAPVQRRLYADAGGQPGHREAWTDPHVNAICPHFFAPTLDSLDASFVRPRVSYYPAYQRDGGLLLHARLKNGDEAAKIVAEMNALWMHMRRQSTG
jgi:multiple sugar transport system substrate-binding protein